MSSFTIRKLRSLELVLKPHDPKNCRPGPRHGNDFCPAPLIPYQVKQGEGDRGITAENMDKNSSGDEIANVNFFTTISHTYFKTPKREPISFNKLDDSYQVLRIKS